MDFTNPMYQEHLRKAEVIAKAIEAAEAASQTKLSFNERTRIAESTPTGTLAGENLATLEALAWHHLFGLALALKKGRCTKALKNLTTSVNAELSKGPLEAHGYAHKGYGAIVEFINRVRDDAGVYSRRATPYRCALREYSHSASFFWYQLQHLTDIPQYRDDAAAKCEMHVNTLIEMEP